MWKPKLNLVGQKFNRLTVTSKGKTEKRRVFWNCLCDCGNTKEVRGDSLKAGSVKSCGCLKEEREPDLTNQKFNRLTVLRKTKDRTGYWDCLCDCGKTVSVKVSSITTGDIKSCGCLKAEREPDLTGRIFGELTVIKKSEKRGNRDQIFWDCLCSCGKEKSIPCESLKRGHSKSCGCKLGFFISIAKSRDQWSVRFDLEKRRSKKRNLSFTLTIDEFKAIVKQSCFYCDAKPQQILTRRKDPTQHILVNGIDRVDNSKGYELDNCVPCCGFCNVMKSAHTQDEFLNKIRDIATKHPK